MVAVFVTDSVQVEFLQDHFPDCQLLPLSTQAYAAALKWRPSSVASYFDYIDFEECQRQYHREALQLSKTWLKQLGLKFQVEGIDLATLDSVCQFQLLTHCTYIETTARNLIAARPDIQTFHVVSSSPPLPHEFYFESDVASAILQFVCRELGRTVKVIEMERRPRFLQPQFKSRPIRRSSYPPSLFPILDRSKRRVGFIPATVSNPRLIIDTLQELHCQTVIFPSAWGDPPLPDDTLTFELSSLPGAWSNDTDAELARLRTQIAERANRSSLPASVIRNPLLNFQWDYIIHQRWPMYANMVQNARTLVKALPLDLLILSEHFTAEGAILSRFYRQRGTQILIAPHSSWPCDPNWAIADRSDGAFTVARSSATRLRELSGMSKVVSIGKPRVTSYRSLFHPPPIRNAIQEKKQAAGQRKIVMLVSNALEIDSVPLTDLGPYFQTMSVLAKIPDRMKNLVLMATRTKGGPLGEDPILYSSLSGFTPEMLSFLDGLTFSECIDLADCVVGMNIPTGGYFEVLDKGVPLLHFQPARLTTLQPDFPPSVVPRIMQPAYIWAEIESVLFDASHRQSLLERQQAFIRQDRRSDDALEALLQGRQPKPTVQGSSPPLRLEALERCLEGARGNVDDILLGSNNTAIVVGWAVDLIASKPARGIHVFLDRPRIATSAPSQPRTDVAALFEDPALRVSGYSVRFPLNGALDLKRLRVFAELHDGRFFELPKPVESGLFDF